MKKTAQEQIDAQTKNLERQYADLFLRFAGVSTADQTNKRGYIKEGFQKNPTVNSIVNITQKNAGMAKWGIYKVSKDGTKEPVRNYALEELLRNPSNLFTWNETIQHAIGMKMLTGNTYLWGIPSEVNKGVKSLYVLPSANVTIRVADNQRSIAGYNLDFFGQSPDEAIPESQVLHIRNFNPDYDDQSSFLYGQSPLRAAYRSLQTNNDSIDTSRNYLVNQGPRGYFYEERDLEKEQPATQAQVDRLRSWFKRNFTGTKNAGNIFVSPRRLVYNKMGDPSTDLQLIEQYNLTQREICNVYGFPSALLGSGITTYSNSKEMKKMLWTNVINPMLCEIRDELNKWLVPMYGEGLCIDYSTNHIEELQEDIKLQAEAIQKLQGIITVNEGRSILGLAPYPGPEGDELFIFTQGTKENGETESGDERERPETTSEQTE